MSAPFPIRRATPPEGLTAGELGSTLTMQGADLTMMVVSWAQLGYILIQVDGGRVLLHKRMDMGNERSAFEVRCFKSLFGKRQMIDGSSLHYAKLCRKIAAAPPNTQAFYRRSSGNPKLFRILAAGIGLFGGMSLGAAISGESTLRGLTIFLLSILGAAGSWFIQSWAKDLHMRSKQNLWIALAITGVWLFLSLTAKEFNVAAAVVSGEFLAGLFSAYGGRRTGLGRQAMAQVLGLRRYLKTVSPEDLQRINRANPEYFYSLAPYALALGVDGTFAKHFGSTQLPGCPYLTTGMDGHMTAMEWSRLMRSAVSSLDARQKRLPLERFLAK